MGMKKHKPSSPGRRFAVTPDFDEITLTATRAPSRARQEALSGRNSVGNITVRRRGGGHKRRLRVVDFKRATRSACRRTSPPSSTIRTARRASRSCTTRTARSAIPAPVGLSVGDTVAVPGHADIKPGNCLKLKHILLGTIVHNVEMRPSKAAARALGRGRRSGWRRKASTPPSACRAARPARSCSSAARRRPGRQRPALEPQDRKRQPQPLAGSSPEGPWRRDEPRRSPARCGGEGRSSGGRHPVTPWGFPTKGQAHAYEQVDQQVYRQASPLGAEESYALFYQERTSSTSTCSRRSTKRFENNSKRAIKTWSRRSTILPDFVT